MLNVNRQLSSFFRRGGQRQFPGLLALTILFLVPSNVSYAQLPFQPILAGGNRPIVIGVRYDYYETSDSHHILGEFSRRRDLGFFPKNFPLSYTALLNFAAGARIVSDGSSEFIWRAGLFDMDVDQKLFAFGLTVLDFDESGILQRDYQWIKVRLGLGYTLGGQALAISPQLVGILGQTSMTLGEEDYPDIGALADTGLSGLDAGFRGSVGLRIAGRIVLAGIYTQRYLVDNPELLFETIRGELRVRFGKISDNGVAVFVRYTEEDVELNNSDLRQENRFVKAGLQFIFQPKQKTRNIWENWD